MLAPFRGSVGDLELDRVRAGGKGENGIRRSGIVAGKSWEKRCDAESESKGCRLHASLQFAAEASGPRDAKALIRDRHHLSEVLR